MGVPSKVEAIWLVEKKLFCKSRVKIAKQRKFRSFVTEICDTSEVGQTIGLILMGGIRRIQKTKKVRIKKWELSEECKRAKKELPNYIVEKSSFQNLCTTMECKTI